MSISANVSEAQNKLDTLEAELEEIEAILKRVPELEKRRAELKGSHWRSHAGGEIYQAKLALVESKSPVFGESKGGFHRATRIVAIDAKWISIKTDGSDEKYIVRYKISNGWRERSRNDHGAIDVEKALAIWNEHQAKEGGQ
jgi:hypothetical protein